MKNTIKITLIAVIALGLNTGRATAGDEAAAAIGGFVLGMITGAVLEDHNDNVHVSVSSRHGCDRSCRKGCHSCHPRDRGHWEIRKVKVWVPGYWDVSYTRCGDRIRVWKKGHYTYQKERVWVSYRDRGHRKHDRGYGCRSDYRDRKDHRDYRKDRKHYLDYDRRHDKDFDRDDDHVSCKNRKERWFRG